MAIPYQTAKFKSANIFAMAILGPITKFNSRQYFWLYGILFTINIIAYLSFFKLLQFMRTLPRAVAPHPPMLLPLRLHACMEKANHT